MNLKSKSSHIIILLLLLLAMSQYYLIITPCFATYIAEQPPQFSARALDSLLQNHAFEALKNPKTGIHYIGRVPKNSTGIEISAVRVRSGSLRRRGCDVFKAISIPKGVTEEPYVTRLVLVYHNLGNWSTLYYPLEGYTYLGPVFGLMAYDGSDLSAGYLPELDIRATVDPILIKFDGIKLLPPKGVSLRCVYFGLDGSVEFDNVVNETLCFSTKQGHFTLAIEYVEPPPGPAAMEPRATGGDMKKNHEWVWVICGCCIIGGFLLLCVLIVCLRKCRRRKMIRGLEQIAEGNVLSLGTKMVMRGVGPRVPVAMGTRTRPVLENQWRFDGV